MAKAGTDFLYEEAELVLGLVAPVGTDFDKFVETLGTCLKAFRYKPSSIRLSSLAASLVRSSSGKGGGEYERLTRLMDAGNAARARGGDVLALAAAAEIHRARTTNKSQQKEPLSRTAHIVRSLKHPGEVQTLRRIYGRGFFLIGVVASEAERRTFLAARKGCTESEIDKLLARDEDEGDDGQRTRDTFHLADTFLAIDDQKALQRFLGLVFGSPHETPSPDEYAMFLAFSAGLRSADLSRQVGAVIASAAGDIVAVGANDVPIAGGGLCWPGVHDHRDHKLGYDTNERQRREIVDEILEAVRPPGVRKEDWQRRGWTRLKGAAVMDITEYGRAAHAEMEALLSCARSGISTRGSSVFSTTFPCHNCAKHLIAAGIQRVVYVEPYPKSRAASMYPDSIQLGGMARAGSVLFEPFQGVGPRRFFDLFSIGLSSGYVVKRKQNGDARSWEPKTAVLRAPLLPNSYIVREAAAAAALLNIMPRRKEPRK
ncbi:MAG: cytidine deaminase [Myxococcales bacterium]|nr:cytidine deaminase [Myxococcales bacterium]